MPGSRVCTSKRHIRLGDVGAYTQGYLGTGVKFSLWKYQVYMWLGGKAPCTRQK